MSFAVNFAISSILFTSACDVGTHTTSLPSWPTTGSKPLSFLAAVSLAHAPAARIDRNAPSTNRREIGIACIVESFRLLIRKKLRVGRDDLEHRPVVIAARIHHARRLEDVGF